MQTFYKNQLFQIIRQAGLNSQLFEIHEEPEGQHQTTMVSLTGSDLRFIILENPRSFHHFNCKFSLNKPQISESSYRKRLLPFRLLPGHKARYPFKEIETQFVYWLGIHVEAYLADQQEIDLWAQAQNENVKEFQKQYRKEDRHEYFSDVEKARIIKALNNARKEAEEKLSMTEEDLAILNEKVDYLMDAVKRLNKFDWKSILLSSTIDIVSDLTLDPSGGKMLFDIFTNAFSGIPKLLS